MEVRRSNWYAVLVLPSEGFDMEEGMTTWEGVVAMTPDAEDKVVLSTQVMISVV